MKSVALHNLGCKVNAYELDVMGQMLQEKGYKIVPFDESADIYIINTCTVTNIADRKSRQMLHRAKKNNPDAVVVAVGCYVQTGGENIEKEQCIDLAVGNNRKKDLVPILEAFLRDKNREAIQKAAVIDINHTDEYEEMTLKQTGEHTRAYIKIQDGCNQFCSYCIIPYARGRVRSRRTEDILSEVKGLAETGYREIVLTGIHISSYGADTDGDTGLLELILALHKIEGIQRIRLGSLEPRIMTEEFAACISKMEKICPHFHLSLQSGCDETLQRMNRRYCTGEYYEKVQILRKYFAAPAITTDIITGFPGETEEEFEITRKFVEKVKFYETHIFKYSKRQGTRAAEMEHQIPESVKAERSRVLAAIHEKNAKEYREQFLRAEKEVLFEESRTVGDQVYMIGHTMEYLKVAKLKEKDLSNQMVKGTITGFLEDDILLLQ